MFEQTSNKLNSETATLRNAYDETFTDIINKFADLKDAIRDEHDIINEDLKEIRIKSNINTINIQDHVAELQKELEEHSSL